MNEHFKRLEQMFHSAPIQEVLPGATMTVSKGTAEYSLLISEDYFHAANAMHGAVYFKLLDDSAYFAAASLEETYFILTKSYTIHFKKPVKTDLLKAIGQVKEIGEKEIIVESRIYNQLGKVVGYGEGVFVRGPKLLGDLPGYSD